MLKKTRREVSYDLDEEMYMLMEARRKLHLCLKYGDRQGAQRHMEQEKEHKQKADKLRQMLRAML
jgi:hypothetical protein